MIDQKVTIDLCPILKPTQKQFANFYQYIQQIEAKFKDHYGMVKVIPPKSWKSHDSNYETLKKQMKVRKPIEQHAKMSKNQYYQIRNIIQESMNLEKFQKKIADKTYTNQSSPQKIQQNFWKTIKYTPPVYGADLHKSLMGSVAGNWNLAQIDSLLRDAAPVLIKGVTYPYCYVGTWKSIFCWHKQDLDLGAINYLHQGKQKYWYCIQNDDQEILQKEAHQAFPQSFTNCKNFMRHKTTLINPYKLKQKHKNLKISKAYQGPNQFIVAFSGSYHCGFNSGKNIAQAVNFATRDWLRKLQNVSYCECTQSSVKPNYKFFLDNLQKESSRYKDDPLLKHLKNWVIKNDLYLQYSVQDQGSTDDRIQKKSSKKSSEQQIKNTRKKRKIKKTDKSKKENTKTRKSNKKLKKKKAL